MTLNILIDKCLWMINAELTKSCLFTEYPCTARSVLFDWHTGFTLSLIHVPAKSCSHNSGYNMLNVILTTKYQNKLQLFKKKKKQHQKQFLSELIIWLLTPSFQILILELLYAFYFTHLIQFTSPQLTTWVECGRNPKCVMWGCSRTWISKHFCNLLCNVWTIVPFQNVSTGGAARQLLMATQLPEYICHLACDSFCLISIDLASSNNNTHTTTWFEQCCTYCYKKPLQNGQPSYIDLVKGQDCSMTQTKETDQWMLIYPYLKQANGYLVLCRQYSNQ